MGITSIFTSNVSYKPTVRDFYDYLTKPIPNTNVYRAANVVSKIHSLEFYSKTEFDIKKLEMCDIIIINKLTYIVKNENLFFDVRSGREVTSIFNKSIIYNRYTNTLFNDYKTVINVYKLDVNKLDSDTISNMEKENGVETLSYNKDYSLSDNIKIDTSRYNSIPGALLIGDVLLTTGPLTISFSTQNGYDYFPTIRTQGNPKVPSQQEVKSVNFSLLFPNIDTINNQLLPIFAMFKRAPFVNIKNKDICNFFFEIQDDEGFIAVALESFNAESVQGFPSAIQLNISVLPIQRDAVSKTFSAVTNFDGIRAQQAINRDTREFVELNSVTLREQSNINRYVDPNVEYTQDFRKSIPFRSYYQSLLRYRNVVCDELGSTVITGKGLHIPLENFRPTKNESYINRYVLEHNNKPITLKYDYLKSSPRDMMKELTDARNQANLDLSEEIKTFRLSVNNLNRIPNLLPKLKSDFIDKLSPEQKLEHLQNAITSTIRPYIDALNVSGLNINFQGVQIDVNDHDGFFQKLTSIIGLQLASLSGLFSLSFKEMQNSLKDSIKELKIENLEIVKLLDEKITRSVTNIQRGLTLYEDGQILNLEEYSKKLVTELETLRSMDNKDAEAILNSAGVGLQSIFNLVSESGQVGLFFKQFIAEDSIYIDGKNDVITGWGITFYNKFIPIQLSGFKYPIYQHIGSDDVNLSLSIFSAQNGRSEGLKEQISMFNDRLGKTVRVIQNTVPELNNIMDFSLRLDTNSVPGHIMNVFGLSKVTFNNSNTSSINGKPNCWSINTTFTQNIFSLRDYHSIGSLHKPIDVQDDVLNLLLRSQYTPNSDDFTMYKLVLPISEAGENKGDQDVRKLLLAFTNNTNINLELSEYKYQNVKHIEIDDKITVVYNNGDIEIFDSKNNLTNINNMLLIAFFEAYCAVFINNDISDTKIDLNKDIIFGNNELFENTVFAKYLMLDNIKTNDMRGTLNNNESLKASYLSILNTHKEYYRNQYDIIHGILNNTPKNSQFWGNLSTASAGAGMLTVIGLLIVGVTASIASAPVVGSASLGYLVLSGIAASLKSIFTAIGVTGLLSGGASVVQTVDDSRFKLESDIKNFVEKNKNLIETLFTEIRKKNLSDISRLITKDIKMLEMLMGENKVRELTNIIYEPGINCYKDFDIDISKINMFNDSELKFSFTPDFYLLNNFNNINLRDSYINNILKEKLTAVQIYANLVVNDTVSIIKDVASFNFKDYNRDGFKEFVIRTFNENSGNFKLTEDDGTLIGNINNKPIEYSSIIDEVDRIIKLGSNVDNNTVFYNTMVLARLRRILQLTTLEQEITKSLIFNNNVADTSDKRKIAEDVKNLLSSYIDSITKLSETDDRNRTRDSIRKKVDKLNELDSVYLNNQINAALFNILDEIIILDSAIEHYSAHKQVLNNESVASIKELQLLKYHGSLRNVEESQRNISLLYDAQRILYNGSVSNSSNLFPTFKIMFIQEHTGLIVNFDDYYSYNAINTIDIVANKNTPGKTAVVKLSNIFGALTDRISLLTSTFSEDDRKNNMNKLFFGTLDIKPGTKIIIKMGYDADDRDLPVAFIGKIIELKPGNITEIVCQSHATQLHHYIELKNIGAFSRVRSIGDVAISSLDEIPSLKGLGSRGTLNSLSTRFTGSSVNSAVNNYANTFIMSNLFDSFNFGKLTDDNPRDENLFLDIKILSQAKTNWTFDWIIKEQSVWSVLNEISLYFKNTFPTVKYYNNDRLSNLDELRETIVLGNKSGFYKYTDSHSFSNMNYTEAKSICDRYNKIIKNITRPNFRAFYRVIYMNTYTLGGGIGTEGLNFEKFSSLNTFFKDKHTRLVFTYLILNNLSSDSDRSKFNLLVSGISSILGSLPPKYKNLSEFYNSKKDYIIPDYLKAISYTKNAEEFFFSEIRPEQIMHVESKITDNTDARLATNLAYKKLQNHHFISDKVNIIHNGITLNEMFNNAVQISFSREPKEYTDIHQMSKSEVAKLRHFTVRAFRETPDDYLRVKNVYQRNIDTNLAEIKSDTDEFYSLANLQKNNKEIKDLVKDRWRTIPKYVSTSISLLQREVSTMYSGEIIITGNSNIEPFDIIHIDDEMNGIKGTVEVEEVLHTFNPQVGFMTTIKPNAIVYDRDPITTHDLNIIDQLSKYGTKDFSGNRLWSDLIFKTGLPGLGAAGALSYGMTIAGSATLGLAFAVPFFVVAAGFGIYSVVSGSRAINNELNSKTVFRYNTMASLYGGDCINFVTITHNNSPLIAGFGPSGPDYRHMQSIINEQSTSGNYLQRYITATSENDTYNLLKLGGVGASGVSTLDMFFINSKSPILKSIGLMKLGEDINSDWSFGDFIENFMRKRSL